MENRCVPCRICSPMSFMLRLHLALFLGVQEDAGGQETLAFWSTISWFREDDFFACNFMYSFLWITKVRVGTEKPP